MFRPGLLRVRHHLPEDQAHTVLDEDQDDMTNDFQYPTERKEQIIKRKVKRMEAQKCLIKGKTGAENQRKAKAPKIDHIPNKIKAGILTKSVS